MLQDQFFTVRAERYVLPLKASAKSLGLGIVHDTSRTGETVFVEPTALVAVNNRLKVIELDIRRESRRILEALTADVAVVAPALRRDGARRWRRSTRARRRRGWAVAYGGTAIAIVEAADRRPAQPRAPAAGAGACRTGAGAVVANDVALGGGQPRILIVSGPNAGGKTVLMKTVGLAALMARAGLLVAAAPGSRVGFFDAVRADIGDRQSVLGDLSTFSGHLGERRANPGRAPRDGGAALVLLDELMAGTNPDQGAALARATAETLAERPVLAVITTHYDSLKALGESDARFANAGMEYDLERAAADVPAGDRARPGGRTRSTSRRAWGCRSALLERARDAGGRLQRRPGVGDRAAARRARRRWRATPSAWPRREAAAARHGRRAARGRGGAGPGASASSGRKSREAVEAAIAEAREAIAAIVRDAQAGGHRRAPPRRAREELARVGAEALAQAARARTRAASSRRPALETGARVLVERLGATACSPSRPTRAGGPR